MYWSIGKNILDPELVYAKALACRLVNPDFDFEQILFYEFAPFLPSLFDKENVLQTKLELNKNLESWV